ncbi:MAG: hypothetical protein ACJAYA_001182 [Bacteroidia bacterium]|jgi:hypothetical protein
MNFLHRFKFFAIGVGLGCLVVYGLLIRDRDFPAWLPEDRVLEELAVDSIIIRDGVQLSFADSLLTEHILDSDVIFDESSVRDMACREYQLESDTERMRFKICNKRIELYEYKPK